MSRAAFLLDWSRRDRAMGLEQCRRDELAHPGITRQVQDQLDLDEEFARRGANVWMVVDEREKFARGTQEKKR